MYCMCLCVRACVCTCVACVIYVCVVYMCVYLLLFVYSKQTAKLIPPLVSRQYKPQQWLDNVQSQFQSKAQHMTVKKAQDTFTGDSFMRCFLLFIHIFCRYCYEITNVWIKILSCYGNY